MPFLGGRAERFGEDYERTQLDGNLASLCREERSFCADEITEIEVSKDIELFIAEDLFLRIDLDTARLIFEINELAFAHVAMGGNSPRDRDFPAFNVIGPSLAAALSRRKFVGKRINAFPPQSREFGFPLFDQ
jgi:hypothetical protein